MEDAQRDASGRCCFPDSPTVGSEHHDPISLTGRTLDQQQDIEDEQETLTTRSLYTSPTPYTPHHHLPPSPSPSLLDTHPHHHIAPPSPPPPQHPPYKTPPNTNALCSIRLPLAFSFACTSTRCPCINRLPGRPIPTKTNAQEQVFAAQRYMCEREYYICRERENKEREPKHSEFCHVQSPMGGNER